MGKSKRKVHRRAQAKLQRVEVRKGRLRPDVSDANLLAGDALAVLQSLPKSSIDLIMSSPPYNIGKTYERNTKLSFPEYVAWQDKIIEALVDRLKDTGSICWQVGSYVDGWTNG
jgi:DNA modification methylase